MRPTKIVCGILSRMMFNKYTNFFVIELISVDVKKVIIECGIGGKTYRLFDPENVIEDDLFAAASSRCSLFHYYLRQVKLPLISDLVDLVDVESASHAEKFARTEELSRKREQPGYNRPLGPGCRGRRSSSERARARPNATGPVEMDQAHMEPPRELRDRHQDSDRLGGTKGGARCWLRSCGS